MGWIEASAILFGGLVAIMGLGLPVAFAFLALNIVGAWLFLGGEPGLTQLARNAVQSVTVVLADADPVLRADGRGAVPDRSRAEGDRRVRAADPPRAGPPLSDRDRRRHGVLGDLRLDHRHHRPARQPDAADHAGARLRAEDGDGPDHGHRRRRHADPALRAHRAARLHRRHLDLRPADRRHRAGADPLACCSSATSSRAPSSIHRWRRTKNCRRRKVFGSAGGRSSSTCCRWWQSSRLWSAR